MNSYLSWIKKNYLVICATIGVALFTGLPTIVFFQNIDNEFNGLYPVFNGDALYYQARIQDMEDGHFSLNHQYFFEEKDSRFPQGVGADYFIYGITKLFNISNPALQIVLDFLMPALIFLLTFALFKRFSRNKYTVVLFPLILYTFAMGGGLLKPMRPQVVLPILLLFLLCWTALIIKRDKKILYSCLSGLLLGLLFLSYYYFWSFAIVLIGLYILILLMRKSYMQLKHHGLMLGIGVLIGLPYFIRFWQSLNTAYHTEIAARIGIYYSHLPESYPRLIVALVWLLFFVWFSRRYKIEQEKKTHIIAVLLIANVLYPNHQIITGIIMENALHWSWMPILVFGISAHYMVAVLQKKHISFNKHGLILGAVFIMFLLPAYRLHTFMWSKYLGLYRPNFALNHQYYADVFDWINNNTNKDDVIYSDMDLMSYVPAYTSANVYDSKYAFVLPGSDKMVVERTLLSHFFEKDYFIDKDFGFSKGARILWFFQNESEKNTHTIAGKWKIPYESVYSVEREKEFVSQIYNNMAEQGWDAQLLKKYRVDYIIWDTNLKPEWNLEQYNELKLIDQVEDVLIYKIL